MKKTLLLQTALVAAAGLFVADVANAQAKAVPLGVTVGGYFTQFYKVQDRDDTQTNQASQGFASDAEIWFNIRGVLDNGTVIGGRVELEATSYTDQIDETFLFLERADLGRAEIGATDRVSGKMLYFAPNSLPGHSTTVNSEYTAVNGGFAGAPLMWFVNANHDANGINLYSSSNRYFGSKAGKGLQLGFSYVPDGCEDFSAAPGGGSGRSCGGGFGSVNDTGQLSNQYNVAANYLESFGPLDVALYTSYNSVKLEASNNLSRQDGWQAGAQFGWNIGGGSVVQFGGGYTTEDVGRDRIATGTTTGIRERDAYSVGIRYLTNGAAPGSVGIGVEYYNREDTLATRAQSLGGGVSGEASLDYYHLGLTYQLASGVLTFAGIGVADQDNIGTASDVEQTFGVVGVGLTF